MTQLNDIKRRNLAAKSPLLRKAGPHLQSKSGKRQKDKLATRRLVADTTKRLLIPTLCLGIDGYLG